MEEVKKNIKTFLEILQIGRSESVIHWDESNFKRAQQWAQYAEEVYKKLKNKPSFVQVLSNYMRLQDTVCLAFTFSDLHVAAETLRRVLLNNPHLSSTQFSFVLDMYPVDFFVETNKEFEKVIQDTYSISCSKGIFLTLSSMKDQLSIEHLTEGCKRIDKTERICLDACAKLFWEKIWYSMAKQKENRLCNEGRNLIKKIESLVLCSDKGMEVVLRMLVLLTKGKMPVNTLSNGGSVLDHLKDHIQHWIVECSNRKESDNYKKIWSCPSSLLCEISAFDTLFCESYLSFLHSCGDRLLGIGSDTVDQTSYDCSYRHIHESMQLLIQGPDHISELCKQKFKLWSVEPCGERLNTSCDMSLMNQKLRANLWKKICHETCK